ncbi:MAG: CoA transferase [Gammaproteobacteria bacterium]|nr:CoA transferase [Gammaproteobacteria bacterium]
MNTPHDQILEGIRILDFTRALAGPTCTRLFAELGAEVIKVESAPGGDMTRRVSKIRNERSLYYVQQSLNKKSVCVDFRQPAGLALLKDLVKQCDVVVENFKPGVIAEMGLGFDVLQKLKPDIILCSISALGQSGPLAGKPGYDYIAQAYSGVTSMIGPPDEAPMIPLVGVGDVMTGAHAAFAVAAALLYRARTGRGKHIDIGLVDAYYHCHEVNVHQFSGSNGAMRPTRGGRHVTYVCPAGVYRGSGGDIMIMAFLHHWPDLCRAMERTDLIALERFKDDATRRANLPELLGIIEGWLQTFPDVASAIAQMEAHGVPCAPILSVAETVTHPHLVARGTVRTIKDRIAGEFQIPGMPIKFVGEEANQPFEAPTLGQHNAEVLRTVLGKSVAEIAALTAAGVLQAADV